MIFSSERGRRRLDLAVGVAFGLVLGVAPPPAGAPRLRFHRGERIRLRIDTDAPVAIEIPGYGIAETVESGAVVAFRARRAGQFPVVAAASHIGLAELDIAP